MGWFHETIKFNSKYDECYLFEIIYDIAKLDFIRVIIDEVYDSTVYQLMFVYKDYMNCDNLFGINITSYDDGLAYFTNGRIYINDSQNVLRYYQSRVDEINFNYTICFKFIKMFFDINIPNREFLINVNRIIANHIVNFLTSIGFACRTNLIDGLAEIAIDTQSEDTAFLLHNYLFNINWYECLKPLNAIFSSVKIMSDNNSSVKEIRLSSDVKNSLTIELSNDKSVVLRLWLDNSMLVYLYNENKVETYDGWEFAPQLKYIYTNPKWNKMPIHEFKVYGLKQVFHVHDKHLPLMQLNLLRVDGFRINGSEFWFENPQYVEIPFQSLNSPLWNKYVLSQLSGDWQ
jgi:hypothetical protein